MNLLPVFVCSCFVGAVKPAIVPGKDRACKDESGEAEGICSNADDENGGDDVHFRSSVKCSNGVCPGVDLGEDGVGLIGAELEGLSGEGEVVDLACRVMDSDADVPAVFGGVLDGVTVEAGGSGKGGVGDEVCDCGGDDGPGGCGDDDAADGFSFGFFDVLDGGFVGFVGYCGSGEGLTGGLVAGGTKRVGVAGEGGDDAVEGFGGDDRGGKGAGCCLYDCGGDEVDWHGIQVFLVWIGCFSGDTGCRMCGYFLWCILLGVLYFVLVRRRFLTGVVPTRMSVGIGYFRSVSFASQPLIIYIVL